MNKVFLITYNLYTESGNYFDKQIKVHKDNELYAKVGLENYLRKKYKDFTRLEIIKCEIDYTSLFNSNINGNNDIFNNFMNIFNTKK